MIIHTRTRINIRKPSCWVFITTHGRRLMSIHLIGDFNLVHFSHHTHLSPDTVSSHISFAPIIHLSGAFYLVGGKSESGNESVIGRFDIATQKWANVGNLARGRNGHNVIYDGEFLLVIGGDTANKWTEKCSVSNEKVACISQTPELTSYSDYPELFLVKSNFCED